MFERQKKACMKGIYLDILLKVVKKEIINVDRRILLSRDVVTILLDSYRPPSQVDAYTIQLSESPALYTIWFIFVLYFVFYNLTLIAILPLEVFALQFWQIVFPLSPLISPSFYLIHYKEFNRFLITSTLLAVRIAALNWRTQKVDQSFKFWKLFILLTLVVHCTRSYVLYILLYTGLCTALPCKHLVTELVQLNSDNK